MKTIQDLLFQEPIFKDLFKEGVKSIASEFSEDEKVINQYKILYAYYSYEDWSGDAYLLLLKDDKIYEVDGGHCSCYGLEGQFKPEELPIEVIEKRIKEDLWNSYHLKEVFC